MELISKISTLISLDLSGSNVANNLTRLVEMEDLQWLLLRDMDLSSLSEPSISTPAEIPQLSRLAATNSNLSGEYGRDTEVRQSIP